MGNKINKIAVIMPPPSNKPVGGYKIIYKYCDLLISTCKVKKVDYYYSYYKKDADKGTFFYIIRKILYKTKKRNFYRWYDFKNDDNMSHHIGISKKQILNSDIIFVSSVETAYLCKNLSLTKPVFYFIQGFEDWSLKPEEVINSYLFGFKNITVSKWIQDILIKNNAPVHLWLSNPVDENFFKTREIESRKIQSVLFMYHTAIGKGSSEAIEAMVQVKENYPSAQFSCFSAFPRPNDFPEWLDFHYQPTKEELRELMNDHFIFLSSSYQEGFGLPPAEAMNCGCCVLTTRSGGVNDFAVHKETAYMVDTPPKPEKIVKMIHYIFKNKEEAIETANNGYKNIKKVSWSINLERLSELITKK